MSLNLQAEVVASDYEYIVVRDPGADNETKKTNVPRTPPTPTAKPRATRKATHLTWCW